MDVLPKFANMAKTPEQIKEDTLPFDARSYPTPVYPYGLSICLENEQLEKLNLSGDCDVGDMIYMQAIGKITSASKQETTEGIKARVEIQLTDIALSEEHADEAEDAAPRKMSYGKFYTTGG